MIMITLIRQYEDDKQTLGTIVIPSRELFVAKTLELADRGNQPNISCIPTGIYKCTWTRSNRLSKIAGHDVFTYEVLDVPDRSGIRIHSANYFFQLKGCIALGDTHKDINLDNELDVIHSGDTVKRFADILEGKDFLLEIN